MQYNVIFFLEKDTNYQVLMSQSVWRRISGNLVLKQDEQSVYLDKLLLFNTLSLLLRVLFLISNCTTYVSMYI